ncbi:MAG: PorV/PorQ family protein [Candidatus Delongbacteria bacterium]|nr:PorV/PorQ family protein [Candidatus Delongbacteria bacterium]MBN2835565.1 PorV/PorQ family protein [Candidatus Delongbacteria bacterium]
MGIKKIVITAMLILASVVFSRPSEAGVIFLNIDAGARATGMGNSFVALADDATATYWNPAGLAYQEGKEFSVMYANWLPGFNLKNDTMYYMFSAYKQNIPGLGTIGGNIVYLYLGEMQRTNELGQEEGTFTTYETAATLSYGTDLSEELAIGLNVKFIYSHLSDQGAGKEKGSGTGYSTALDLGLMYLPTDELSIGMSISNMGPKISYIDYEQADPLPTNLKLGFAYYLLNDDINSLVITGDMNKLLVRRGIDTDDNGKIEGDEVNETDPIYKAIFTSWTDDDGLEDIIWGVGAEYWYNDLVALRAGMWKDKMGDISATTVGTSFRFSDYIFDMSYLIEKENHPLNETLRLAVNFLM